MYVQWDAGPMRFCFKQATVNSINGSIDTSNCLQLWVYVFLRVVRRFDTRLLTHLRDMLKLVKQYPGALIVNNRTWLSKKYVELQSFTVTDKSLSKVNKVKTFKWCLVMKENTTKKYASQNRLCKS